MRRKSIAVGFDSVTSNIVQQTARLTGQLN